MTELNQEKQEFDIAIVGGGMAGVTAALCYSQLGLSVALIEAVEPESNASTSFDQRAVALSASSVKIFQSLGLWNLIQPFACPIEQIHVSDKGNFGFTRLTAEDYQVDALGQVITLEQVGPILWRAAQNESAVATYCPAKVESFDQEDKACNLHVKIEEDIVEVKAKLVLAADGTFSKMAEDSEIAVARKSYNQHAVVANIQTHQAHNHRAFERFTTNGPLALLPLARNLMGVVWCQKPEAIDSVLTLNDQDFCQALQNAFGQRLGKIEKVGKRFSYPLSLHLAEQHFKQRILLLGNAAHTLHPIAGQGFNLGLRDIAGLNDCLIEALKSNKDIGDESVLKAYVASRQKDWQQTVFATDTLTRIFSNDFLPLVIARNKAMSWLNLLPFAKRQLADAAMGFGQRSSRLARGLANRSFKKKTEQDSTQVL